MFKPTHIITTATGATIPVHQTGDHFVDESRENWMSRGEIELLGGIVRPCTKVEPGYNYGRNRRTRFHYVGTSQWYDAASQNTISLEGMQVIVDKFGWVATQKIEEIEE